MKKVEEEKKVNTVVPERTEASKIWAEIKDKQVSMFALPNQTVQNYCTYQDVEPSKCYLVLKVSSLLPVLEEVLGKSFKVELLDKWTVVSRVK
jgi:hypothetical protein